MFDAISERRGLPVAVGEVKPHASFIEHLRRNQAKYLLVDKGGTRLGDSLLTLVRMNAQVFRPVYELRRAALYEISAADRR